MSNIAELKNKASEVKTYWKTPPEGRYINFKEIASLAVGGIGVRFITYCVSNMIIAVGNTLLGNTIGIDPMPLYVIYLLSILSSFPLTAIRAKMIDNSKSSKGKYRPYILRMGIPTVIIGILFIWTPYERLSLFWKCFFVLLYNIGFQFFYNFMNDSYESLINVLSPNSIERSDVLSIRYIVENLSPSIAGIFLPIVAKLITGNNTLYDLKVYRVLYPPMLIVGFLISILVYVNTEERIVQAKSHIIQITFMDALRQVARNKYFWIISLAGWIGFLESSFNAILGWMYNYQNACSAAQYSVIIAIVGNASFWPNIVAPFFIRKYGKKKILVISNVVNIGLIALMLPIVKMTGTPNVIWMLVAIIFMNQFITSLGHLLNPSLNADIRDYQQYISGERIDGMFSAVGLVGNVITLATSSVLPAIYNYAGLNQETAKVLGYAGKNVYDVLFNTDYFINISTVLIMASVVGATLNVIPYFFYDLDEVKQRAMVAVLKVRAVFEDYGNGNVEKESLREVVDLIKESKTLSKEEKRPLNKSSLQNAKKSKDKEKVKSAKAELKTQKERNEKIEIAKFIIDEIERYKSEEGMAILEYSQKLADAGIENFINIGAINSEHVSKKFLKDQKRKFYLAQKTVEKYFSNGISEFDTKSFEELFKQQDDLELLLHRKIKARKSANDNGDKASAQKLKIEIANIQTEKAIVKTKIKELTKEYSRYNMAAKPYLDAVKTLKQASNYSHAEELVLMGK